MKNKFYLAIITVILLSISACSNVRISNEAYENKAVTINESFSIHTDNGEVTYVVKSVSNYRMVGNEIGKYDIAKGVFLALNISIENKTDNEYDFIDNDDILVFLTDKSKLEDSEGVFAVNHLYYLYKNNNESCIKKGNNKVIQWFSDVPIDSKDLFFVLIDKINMVEYRVSLGDAYKNYAIKTACLTSEQLFSNGEFKVGTDFKSGEYMLLWNNPNDKEASYSIKSSNGKSDGAVIFNMDYGGYNVLTLRDGEYITLKGDCGIVKYGHLKSPNPIDGFFYSGYYRVGIDIPEGEYRIEPEYDDESVAIVFSNKSLLSIVKTVEVLSQKYIKVFDGQIIFLDGCKLFVKPQKSKIDK